MTAPDGECRVFAAADLLPAAWARLAAAAGPIRCFNPALLAASPDSGDASGPLRPPAPSRPDATPAWLFAYRLVGADGLRRIALCHLDRDLRPVPGSARPLSDSITFRLPADAPANASTWFADPRLYRFDGRLWLYWNSGWHDPRNYQFLVELDPATLAPVGPARELTLAGAPRQSLEKNWTLFSPAPGVVHIVYSLTPLRILACTLPAAHDPAATIPCRDLALHPWTPAGYPFCHGGLRGGTPPIRHGDTFTAFAHSIHDGSAGYTYAAAAVRFSAAATFAPLAGPTRPLELGLPQRLTRLHPRLNPAVDTVVYPCGAAFDGVRWLISHGLNDEQCALTVVPAAVVDATLSAVPAPPSHP